MNRLVVAFASGFLFALGLGVAGMTQPPKVLGFLDVSGSWDPSLALVMGGAVAVYLTSFRASRRMGRPLLFERFLEPAAARIDARLVLGSAVFGVGWGLAGYCPGPAFASFGAGMIQTAYFVGAMLAGMAVVRAVDRRRKSVEPQAAVQTT